MSIDIWNKGFSASNQALLHGTPKRRGEVEDKLLDRAVETGRLTQAERAKMESAQKRLAEVRGPIDPDAFSKAPLVSALAMAKATFRAVGLAAQGVVDPGTKSKLDAVEVPLQYLLEADASITDHDAVKQLVEALNQGASSPKLASEIEALIGSATRVLDDYVHALRSTPSFQRPLEQRGVGRKSSEAFAMLLKGIRPKVVSSTITELDARIALLSALEHRFDGHLGETVHEGHAQLRQIRDDLSDYRSGKLKLDSVALGKLVQAGRVSVSLTDLLLARAGQHVEDNQPNKLQLQLHTVRNEVGNIQALAERATAFLKRGGRIPEGLERELDRALHDHIWGKIIETRQGDFSTVPSEDKRSAQKAFGEVGQALVDLIKVLPEESDDGRPVLLQRLTLASIAEGLIAGSKDLAKLGRGPSTERPDQKGIVLNFNESDYANLIG